MNFRFTLQPYGGMATRYTCPQCLKHKVFTRYIDTQTNGHLADHVGRCGREDKCGYHYKPAEFFKEHGRPLHFDFNRPISIEPYREPSYLPMEMVQQSQLNQQDNRFMQYLINRFGLPDAIDACMDYRIGTAGHWHGDTIFWQIDSRGRVRTGKVMLYNGQTGKRVKEPFNHIAWMHKIVRKSESQQSRKDASRAANPLSDFRSPGFSDYNLHQCFFGEHLLNWYPDKPVGICESEKSAVIAAICYPKLVWLSAGSLSGLTAQKCRCLAGRIIILVPDVNAYQKWEAKAAGITAQLPSVRFKILSYLELNATMQQREQGLDIADFV